MTVQETDTSILLPGYPVDIESDIGFNDDSEIGSSMNILNSEDVSITHKLIIYTMGFLMLMYYFFMLISIGGNVCVCIQDDVQFCTAFTLFNICIILFTFIICSEIRKC